MRTKKLARILLAAFLSTGLLLGGIPTAYAADATVYDETELRAALAAPGDTHNITLGADITTADGIYISGKTVNFNLGEFDLNIVAADDALSVANATVTINGTTGTLNVQGGHHGVLATGTSSVTVTNAKVTDTALEADAYAVRAYDGSDIVVKGNVVAEGSADGVTAIQAGSSVIVEGNITSANGTGAVACYGAVIDITGNVNSAGGQGLLSDNGVINIDGDVAAPSGCGACAYNSSGSGTGNAQILIDGTIAADTYIRLGSTDKGITDTVPTTKLSYHTYNENGFTVWVKDAGGGISASPVSLPSSGGNSVITLTGAKLPGGVYIAVFDDEDDFVDIEGLTTGDAETQTLALAFPANPSTTKDMVYTVKAMTDRTNWDPMTATVTVAKADAEPEADPPTVVTNAVTGITDAGATLSGNVTSDGGASVSERGFVYGTGSNPQIGGAGVTKVAAGSGTGGFTATLSGLAADTTYHVRAYAINSEGTSYGTDISFRTADDDLDEIPKTGDSSSPWVWWLLGGVSAAGIAALLIFGRRKLCRR